MACLLDQPREKRDLADEVDIARSTLDRAIRELEAINCVRYTDGKYTVTVVGKRIAHGFFEFIEQVELAVEFEYFLRYTSTDTFDLDLSNLADAKLWTPESNDPYAMIHRHVEMLNKATSFRGALPLIGLHPFEAAYAQIVEQGAEHEIVVGSGVAETLQSNERYQSKFQDLLKRENCTISVSETSIPYFVGIFDDEIVQIGVDEDGEPRALLETDQREVRSWAHETIDTYEQEATSVTSVVA